MDVYTIFSDFLTASHIPLLTNADLRARLHQYGYRNMKITASTRPGLERKLMSLLKNEPVISNPVNNRQIQDMWSLTGSCNSSDNEIDSNRNTSDQNLLPINSISLRQGSTNVCDIPNRVAILNKTSELSRNGARSSNTHLNALESPFGCSSSLENDSNATTTSSPYSPAHSTDISTTRNNSSQPLKILHSIENICLPFDNTNRVKPSVFSNASHAISVPQISKQDIGYSTAGRTFVPYTESQFVINFKRRLSALTEEPPRAYNYSEQRSNSLTPLQQRVLHCT